MKILVLSDVESKVLWDNFDKTKLEGVELILSCGDLSPRYLSFIATFTHAPILYVHGNHDGCYKDTPPDGCICIEDDIYVYKGIRILGLGGSMRYKKGPCMYTEKNMKFRVLKLWPKLLKHKGFDILLTHSPAYRLHDQEDIPHTGFQCFLKLLDKYSPAYFVYGHVHKCYGKFVREDIYKSTKLINGWERYEFVYEENMAPERCVTGVPTE